MIRSLCSLFLAVMFASILSAEDWRVWRGPSLNNHAPASAAASVPVTYASGTPSSDGNAVYMVAQVNDTIQASALSTSGEILWQRQVCPYRVSSKFWFGYGSSVLLLENSVVIAVDADNANRGLFALSKEDGRELWKADRPNRTSYATPILARMSGKSQILLSGCNQVASYDPGNGEELWSVGATSNVTCGTMVWNDSMVFASGSYPDPGTFGIRVSGNDAEIVWENRVKCYEQSMLVVGDFLYGISEKGIGYCWRAADGKQMWKERIKGPQSASPLLIGDRIYASNELGQTSVFQASPDGYTNLATNQLGEISFASPIYADGKLILRHASMVSGERKETLFAIGK